MEELVEVAHLHHEVVGVGLGLQREELADDAAHVGVRFRPGHGDNLHGGSGKRAESWSSHRGDGD